MGMSAGAFNTREFFHGKSLWFVRYVKVTFVGLTFVLPIALVLASFAAQSGIGAARRSSDSILWFAGRALVFFRRGSPPAELVLPGHRLAFESQLPALKNVPANLRGHGGDRRYFFCSSTGGGTTTTVLPDLPGAPGAPSGPGAPAGPCGPGTGWNSNDGGRGGGSRHGNRDGLHDRLRFFSSLTRTKPKRGGNGGCGKYGIFHSCPSLFWMAGGFQAGFVPILRLLKSQLSNLKER